MHPSPLYGNSRFSGVPAPYNQVPSLCWLLRGDSIADRPADSFLHSWRDESGLKHHMHQQHRGAAGVRGYLPAVDKTNLLNGHPGVNFDGSFFTANDRLTFGDNITMFWVFKNVSKASSILIDFGGGDPGTSITNHNLWIAMGDGPLINWYFNDPTLDLSGAISVGNYCLCAEVYLTPTAVIDAWVNGSHQTPATSGNTLGIGYGVPSSTGGSGGIWDDPDAPRIGQGGAANSSNNFAGTVYEVAFFNEVLSSGDRTLIESFLLAKYGL